MLICVTQEFIGKGIRWRTAECSVALAINSVLKEGLGSRVSSSSILICSYMSNWDVDKIHATLKTPPPATKFISAFDSPHKLSNIPRPFTFELDIPEHLLRNTNAHSSDPKPD